MDGTALEEVIGDGICKGHRAKKLEAMRYGRASFQDIIRAKESIKSFMQRGEDTCAWGYSDGHVFWCVMNRWHGARKWGWIFPIGWGEVSEEEGHPSQLGWQNFSEGLLHGGEGVCRDS